MHDCEESTHRPGRPVTAACAPGRASSPAGDASARASAPWPTTSEPPPPPPPPPGREGPLRGKDRNAGNAHDGGPGDGNRTHPVDVDEIADKVDDHELGEEEEEEEEEEGGGAKWKGEEV